VAGAEIRLAPLRDPGRSPTARDRPERAFIKRRQEENIATNVPFIPPHIHPYYRRVFGNQPEDFPNALRAYEGTISLPPYPGPPQFPILRKLFPLDTPLSAPKW